MALCSNLKEVGMEEVDVEAVVEEVDVGVVAEVVNQVKMNPLDHAKMAQTMLPLVNVTVKMALHLNLKEVVMVVEEEVDVVAGEVTTVVDLKVRMEMTVEKAVEEDVDVVGEVTMEEV